MQGKFGGYAFELPAYTTRLKIPYPRGVHVSICTQGSKCLPGKTARQDCRARQGTTPMQGKFGGYAFELLTQN
jgi:hypothetical protein